MTVYTALNIQKEKSDLKKMNRVDGKQMVEIRFLIHADLITFITVIIEAVSHFM